MTTAHAPRATTSAAAPAATSTPASTPTSAAAPASLTAPEHACPISPVVDIVFSRWTTPILWTLHAHGRQRFVQLQRHIATITPKVLTQRLRQLERDGLVIRTYYPEVPPRVEYEISDLGQSLAPLFAHLAEWATTNLGKVESARGDYDSDPANR